LIPNLAHLLVKLDASLDLAYLGTFTGALLNFLEYRTFSL